MHRLCVRYVLIVGRYSIGHIKGTISGYPRWGAMKVGVPLLSYVIPKVWRMYIPYYIVTMDVPR